MVVRNTSIGEISDRPAQHQCAQRLVSGSNTPPIACYSSSPYDLDIMDGNYGLSEAAKVPFSIWSSHLADWMYQLLSLLM